jgi:hypothetical protein
LGALFLCLETDKGSTAFGGVSYAAESLKQLLPPTFSSVPPWIEGLE